MWLFVAGLSAVACVGALAAIRALETRMLFPTEIAAAAAVSLPPSTVRLEVEAADGARLFGVHIPPEQASDGAPAMLLGFGGNAWNGASLALYLHELFPAAHVVAFHYRGYSPSTGEPSTAALKADAPIVFDHVREKIAEGPVVAVGLSIGAGIAAHLASERDLAGLILVTPFDSLEAVAREHFPWVPVGLLMRHRLSTVDAVRGATTPVAVITAERDTIIPPRRADALRQAIPNLVLDRTIAGSGHNDLYDNPGFRAAMVEAMARVEATR